MLIITALVAGVLSAVGGTGLADTPRVANDEGSALATAKASGDRVEALNKRTETSQEFANPDGSFTTAESVLPTRVLRSGNWVPVDTTLRAQADGSVVPAATSADLVLSGGGSGPFVRLIAGNKQFGLTWPTALAAPVLSGDTATYLEVLPGVDLRVQAQVTGFSELLVVKSPTAAQNPALGQLRFGVSAVGVTVSTEAGGGLVGTDSTGAAVFHAPPPRMWDTIAPAAAPSGQLRAAEAPAGAGGHSAPIAAQVAAGQMTLIPDQGMLSSPDTVFPLYIDPVTTTVGRSHYALVYYGQGSLPSSSHYDDASETQFKVGYADDPSQPPTVTARSFMVFPTGAFAGKHIISATVNTTLNYSWVCHTEVDLWQTHPISAATTWNNQPSWDTLVGNPSPDCSGPLGFSATWSVANAAAAGTATVTFGLRAPNETSHDYWKKFGNNPTLTVTYNSYPDTPTGLTTNGTTCSTGTNRLYVGGSAPAPSLHAVTSDADGSAGQTVRGDFQVGLSTGALGGSDTIAGVADWDGDGHPDVVARDNGTGNLWLYPGRGDGTLEPARYQIGSGWAGWTFVGLAKWDTDPYMDLIVRYDSTGDVWLYPGEGKRSPSGQAPAVIGTGFQGWTYVGVGDWDGDGYTDMVARYDPNSLLMLFPGTGVRAVSGQPSVQVGSGWGGWTFSGLVDWDRDGHIDIVAHDVNGDLWLYPGEGGRHQSSQTPVKIGTGWWPDGLAIGPDLSGDGKPDIVARWNPTYWLYPGSGARSASGASPTWLGGQLVVNSAFNSSGSPADIQLSYGGFTDGGIYTWTARGDDGTDTSLLAGGPCEFGVDKVAPSVAPMVTSADGLYPERDMGAPVGTAGQFTFTANGVADVKSYVYGLNQNPPTNSVAANALGGSATVTVASTKSGQEPNILYAQSVDRAGNYSPMYSYIFFAQPAG